MTLPENRERLDSEGLARLHPSTFEMECKQLRVAIADALSRLDASLFTNSEHKQAKDILRAALQRGPRK